MQRELGGAANNLTEQQREISKTLGATGESIRAAATDTSTQMRESVDQIASKISDSLNQAQSAITKTTESVANRMDAAARTHFGSSIYRAIWREYAHLDGDSFENFAKAFRNQSVLCRNWARVLPE